MILNKSFKKPITLHYFTLYTYVYYFIFYIIVLLIKVPQLNTLRDTNHINIIWRQWYFNTFLSSDISSSFLSNIEDDFSTMRDAGFKATIRFAYTDDQV